MSRMPAGKKRICDKCKNEFAIPVGLNASYSYKIKIKGKYYWYCSYSCYNKELTEMEAYDNGMQE